MTTLRRKLNWQFLDPKAMVHAVELLLPSAIFHSVLLDLWVCSTVAVHNGRRLLLIKQFIVWQAISCALGILISPLTRTGLVFWCSSSHLAIGVNLFTVCRGHADAFSSSVKQTAVFQRFNQLGKQLLYWKRPACSDVIFVQRKKLLRGKRFLSSDYILFMLI